MSAVAKKKVVKKKVARKPALGRRDVPVVDLSHTVIELDEMADSKLMACGIFTKK